MRKPKKLKISETVRSTSNRPTLLVGVFNDPWGSMVGGSGEKEYKEYKKQFPVYLKPFIPHWYHALSNDEVKPGTDILLFDYGGMIGNDLMRSNCRWIIQWCQDNPSSLVLVTSSFTYSQGMIWELKDQGLDSIPNLVNFYEFLLDKEINPIPDWFYAFHKIEPPAPEQPRVATKAPEVSLIKDIPKPWN